MAISISNLGLDVELNYAESYKEDNETIEFVESSLIENKINFNKIKSSQNKSIPTKIRYYVDGKQFMREDLEEINKVDKNLFSEEFNFVELIQQSHLSN